MYISKLELNNFRKFEKLTLKFDKDSTSNINVFIGSNGSGKSTALEAIEYLLQRFTQRSARQSYKNPFTFADITNTYDGGYGESSIELEVILGNQYNSNYEKFDIFSWKIPVNRFDRVYSEKVSRVSLNEIDRLVSKVNSDANLESDIQELPAIMSYRVDRSSIVIPRRNTGRSLKTPIGYYKSLFSKQTSFRNFFEWFEDIENIENQFRVSEINGYGARITPELRNSVEQIKAVRYAIESFMDGFYGLHVDRTSPKSINIYKNGEMFTINQLSHGEKILLALVGDIAKNLVICNPQNENPLDATGIVLIDEVDLHLHPKWQMDILDKLSKTFRNCQFIVTTHSPLVINTADNVNVYNFDDIINGEKLRPQTYLGWSANQMYKQMGANFMENRIYETLNQISNKIDQAVNDKKAIASAKSKLNDLVDEIPTAKNEKLDELRERVNLVSSIVSSDEIISSDAFNRIFGE